MENYDNLLKEIRDQGVEIENINDLIYINRKHKYLIPILLKYLNKFQKENDKMFIVRCLGVRGFIEATNSLISEFYNSSDNSGLKWAIGNTMSLILDKNILDTMIEIVQQKEHGIARQMFVVALGKMKDDRVIPVLLELLNDSDLTGHAIIALSNFKEPKLISHIEPFKNHKNKWVRKEAEKAIKKIEQKNI